MPRSGASQVVYDFDFDEQHEYTVVAARDIEQEHFIEARAGLYAWYLRLPKDPNPALDLASYSRIFGSKNFTLEAKSVFGERYQGAATRQPSFDPASHPFASSVLTASTIFCPPVYIGISINIRQRLMLHLKRLNEALQGAETLLPTDDMSEEQDTADESSAFGHRMGYLLRSNGIRDIERLFVKIIYQPQASAADLKKAEYFVNRTFLPFCGRR
jgi:hypothetical protein